MRAALRPFGTTIFTEMSALALAHGAVNLGQGFPNFPGPAFAKAAAIRAIEEDRNQYARMPGEPVLVEAVARKADRLYGLSYDPLEEVTVFSGCTEAIHVAILSLTEPGDEVLLFEPYYDSYRACVAMAGAVPRFVTMRRSPGPAPAFRWDPAELEASWSSRTRLVLLNTPHNPTGRVLDAAELAQVADLARRHDTVVVTDEVYEHLVYEGRHVPLATLPGMRDRVVTLSSTGKTFSLTGWKIGYALAARPLTAALRAAHQFVTFATSTPMQHAMAEAIREGDGYVAELVASYRRKRDRLAALLGDVGFEVSTAEGTYFLCAGIRRFGFDDDVAFCRHLIEKVGVVAIPPSVFYETKEEGRSYVRFAFCKSDETLDEAERRLAKLRQRA